MCIFAGICCVLSYLLPSDREVKLLKCQLFKLIILYPVTFHHWATEKILKSTFLWKWYCRGRRLPKSTNVKMFLQGLHYLQCILMKCTSVLLQWVVFILRWQWALCVLYVAYTKHLYYILTCCWLTLILYWSASVISSLHNNYKSLLNLPLRGTAGLFWSECTFSDVIWSVCGCVLRRKPG